MDLDDRTLAILCLTAIAIALMVFDKSECSNILQNIIAVIGTIVVGQKLLNKGQ